MSAVASVLLTSLGSYVKIRVSRAWSRPAAECCPACKIPPEMKRIYERPQSAAKILTGCIRPVLI